MRTIAIYLAGSIQKGHENNEQYWTQNDLETIQKALPEYNVKFLNPALRSDDLSDQKSVFGRDMLQVYCCDVVFVDARDRRGLGVGAEMMWAKMNQIPVLSLAPKGSHYHKKETTLLGIKVENWIHPFVESLSDKVVDNIEEGTQWIKDQLAFPSLFAKDVDTIISAMQHYQKNQFEKDLPMQKIINNSDALKERFNEVLEETVA